MSFKRLAGIAAAAVLAITGLASATPTTAEAAGEGARIVTGQCTAVFQGYVFNIPGKAVFTPSAHGTITASCHGQVPDYAVPDKTVVSKGFLCGGRGYPYTTDTRQTVTSTGNISFTCIFKGK